MSYAQPIGLLGLGAADAAPVSIEQLGKIRTKDGYEYQITPRDILWLARSVKFEGGDHAATMWTYAQRQAFYRRRSSLASLIQAHSQPINPLWADPEGEKCRANLTYCTPTHIERRQLAVSYPWERIEPSVRQKLLRFGAAELPNPVPKAVDFANPRVSRSFIDRNPDTEVVLKAGNWYLSYGPSNRGGSQRWPDDFVTIHHDGRVAGPSMTGRLRSVLPYVGGALGLGLAAGFAGWAYYKYGRR